MLFRKNRDEYSVELAPDVTLLSCPSVHLLSVTLDCRLSFKNQILNLCEKAGRSVNALAGFSQEFDVKSKFNLVLFQFIMSHFNYCPCVWHFGRRYDVRKLENVPNRSLKYVFNDFKSPYGELRESAHRPLMYVQQYLLRSTRHILTSAQNIRVTFLGSPIRFIQVKMIRCSANLIMVYLLF